MHSASTHGMEALFDVRSDTGKGLPHASPERPFRERPEVSGIIQLSRVGLNWRRTAALLYFNYRCGFLCGQSGLVSLRNYDGKWHVEQFGSGMVYQQPFNTYAISLDCRSR